jgi:hypothetical protein
MLTAALGIACLGSLAIAQQGNLPGWLHPPHHVGQVPDYAVDIATDGLLSIRMPALPEGAPRYLSLFRGERTPNYLAAMHPHSTGAIRIPPPPAGEAPAVVRGVYMNGWVFASSRFFELVELADSTEINAFVIDVKDATGFLTYRSSVPTAEQIGANRRIRTRNAAERLALLEAHGIHPIARIVVARDALLARNKPNWAIRDSSGSLWYDGLGEPWVDAFNDSVWRYAADLAAEAILTGFREVQFDYVRFPDEPPRRLNRTVYPARRPGESRRAGIRRNVGLLRDGVAGLGVPFTLDVFGLTTSATGDMGIGQVWEDLASAADVILPMVYPSHYRRGAYGLRHPNAEPYTIVRRALEDAIQRSRGLPEPVRIRPYLQAFSIYRVRYTAAEVRAQIQAVEDVGLTEWILWNARGVYPAAAFRPLNQADPLPVPIADSDGSAR